MRRTGWLLGVVLLSFVPATAAMSGGFDSLRFDRQYYAPGQVAHGSTEFWVEVATVEKREPYFAYLLSDRKSFEPPVIPDSAIPLGALTIDLLPEGEENPARASIEFVVPETATGGYQVVLCNRPCRDDSVGALIGGWISVVATAGEARLENFGVKLERRLDRQISEMTQGWWNEIESLRNTTEGLDTRVSGLAVDTGRQQDREGDLVSRLGRAESRLVAVESRITELANRPAWPSSPLHWAVLASGWLAALAIVSLWVRSALRARRPQAPSEPPSVDLGELTESDPDASADPWRPPTEPGPSMTAASRRAMSQAGNGWRRQDA
jgi:hypothetical protein